MKRSFTIDTFSGAELIDYSPGELKRILLNYDKTCRNCGRKTREKLHIGPSRYGDILMFFCNSCKYGFKL